MANISKQLEKAAEAPFAEETAGQFGIEPIFDPRATNFSPEDVARFNRLGILGRFGAYGGLQATFFVENPGSELSIDDAAIEKGLDLLEGQKTVVDRMRPSYKEARITGASLGPRDPRLLALLGGVSFFYDAGHDVFRYCLVYRTDTDVIRHGLRDDILASHGPFDRGQNHTPIERGIIHGVGGVVESLNRGVAAHLLWKDPQAETPATDMPML